MMRSHWSNRAAFILAAAGSAVGLGNLWKFPYITGTNGGGAFVLVYLLCIAAVGIPIFTAELYVGLKGQSNVVESFNVATGKTTRWRSIGWLGLISAVFILSFYSVVGGWVLDFEYRALIGEFLHESESEVAATLGNLFQDPIRQLIMHFIFMLLTVGIVIKGVKAGLERWNKILMPGLMFLLFVLLFYSFSLEGFSQSLKFMFAPNFSKLSAEAALEAVGHAFFTLSLGMGAIITYGSYLERGQKIVRTAVSVAAIDTLIALVAGLVIFSVVFSFGGEVAAGPTLMFQTLPVLFMKLPGAYWISILFFLLVAFAALTSAVSLLEVVVAYWMEKHSVSRTKASLQWGSLIFVLGVLSALSTNILGDFKIFGFTFFDLFDKLTSQYFLPIGGLFISLFFGWRLGRSAVNEILRKQNIWGSILLWLARVVAPAAVAIIIIYKIFQDL